jgi:drug/metabolite transporter (DMT)-like permease
VKSWGAFALAVVSAIAYAFGGTILKKAAIDFHTEGGLFAAVLKAVSSKYVWISLVCSGFGYGLYFLIIRKAEIVTTTLIIQGVLFMATMVFASLLFKEAVTPVKILAAVLITAGIAVLAAAQ